MTEQAAGGQPSQTVAPVPGAGIPSAQVGTDPTKGTTSPAGTPAVNTATPGDAPGQHAQQATITIGNQVFSVTDVQGILSAKKGLETEITAIKAKLSAIETKDMSEKDKAMKEAETLRAENAKLLKTQIDTLIDIEFVKAGVQIKAADWNHGISDPSKVTEAVQNFVKERPGLVKAPGQPGPGVTSPPPGTAAPPPGTAPANSDLTKEMAERYARAKTQAELAELDKEYYALRGGSPPEGRKTI